MSPSWFIVACGWIFLDGSRPIEDEQETPVFEDVSTESGIPGGSFVAWVDYDGDGLADVASGGGLYRNQGDGTFRQVESFPGGDGVWADFDNDGHLDLYRIAGEGSLLRGLGEDRFEAVALPPNVHQHSRAAAWGDANNDGHLDLYVTNYEIWPERAFPDLFYLSRGDGTFADPIVFTPDASWRARGVNWCDFDNDGDQDFYISNYRLMPNHFYVNDGTGVFSEEAEARGVRGTDDEGEIPASDDTPAYAINGHTIGSCFGDLNNDGYMDLVVVNFSHPPAFQDRTMVCLNSGPPEYKFTNINAENAAGIFWQESYAKGALGDFDNDGDLDLFVTTVYEGDDGTLFENDGEGRFTDIGDVAGVRGNDGYGVAWVDYDNDGDLDLSTSGKLMRNRGNTNAWLKVKAVGDGDSNRSAVGARIVATAGELIQIREVQAGNSGNQDPFIAHFGLGEFEGEVTVSIRFPSGKIVEASASANSTLEIRESDIR